MSPFMLLGAEAIPIGGAQKEGRALRPAEVCIIEKRGAETADWHARQSQVGGGVAASAWLEHVHADSVPAQGEFFSGPFRARE
jgi:hypothetical protein